MARCNTSVAWLSASRANDSASGMAVESAWARVKITVWVTSGTVSSRPSRAAAAAYAGTPGVTSQPTPARSSRRVCSASAE